jgi:hypothetical protein
MSLQYARSWTKHEVDTLLKMGGECRTRDDWFNLAGDFLPGRTGHAARFKYAELTRGRNESRKEVEAAPVNPDRVFEATGNGATVEVSNLTDEVRSLTDLVRVCEIDLNEWDVKGWKCKAYAGFHKNKEKETVRVQLFSVSASLIPKKAKGVFDDIRDLIDDLRANALPRLGVLNATLPFGGGERLLELSIPDVHIGKLAWGEECGENYDSKIAVALYMEAVEDLLYKTASYSPDRILLVVGNDLINVDTGANQTTAGTPQSSDGRHLKMFRDARQLITAVIERLILVAPVDVMICPGNHDTFSVFALGEVLAAYFSKTPTVQIDNSPPLRKYYRFGRVLLGFTHGDKEKAGDLPLIMATEKPDLWAATDFREWHVGHLHQRRATNWVGVGENKGVTVRILPSLCAPEDWHVSKGYIGNIRSAEAYVWDEFDGLIGTAVYNVPTARSA